MIWIPRRSAPGSLRAAPRRQLTTPSFRARQGIAAESAARVGSANVFVSFGAKVADTWDHGTGCGIVGTVAVDKLLQKMRKSQAGWRIAELQAVAEAHRVDWRQPGRGGSHVIFSAAGVREIVSVPARRPIKPIYVKQFLALIDAAGEVGKP